MDEQTDICTVKIERQMQLNEEVGINFLIVADYGSDTNKVKKID